LSRIMTPEAALRAEQSNALVQQTVISGAHHHVPLECPERLARAIDQFTATLD
jgi:pimeloyl-ACP methyl ester carboxylesterase